MLPVVKGKLRLSRQWLPGADAVCVNVLKKKKVWRVKNGSSTEEKEDDLDLDFEHYW